MCLCSDSDLQHVRNGLQQLQQFGVSVIRHTALLGKMVVIRWDELCDGHQTGRLVLHQINHLSAELDQLWVPDRTLTALQPRI